MIGRGEMQRMKQIVVVVLLVLLVPLTAVVTAGVKQRFSDGPQRFFSGGELVGGELYRGQEPDWAFVDEVSTIELQLLNPPQSRRIWVAQYDGKLYVWSGYMGTFVGRLWKQWPLQAEADGRAMLRINGVRYRRHLTRIDSGDVLDGIAGAVAAKYPSRMTRSAIESGNVWLFEASPPIGVE